MQRQECEHKYPWEECPEEACAAYRQDVAGMEFDLIHDALIEEEKARQALEDECFRDCEDCMEEAL